MVPTVRLGGLEALLLNQIEELLLNQVVCGARLRKRVIKQINTSENNNGPKILRFGVLEWFKSNLLL